MAKANDWTPGRKIWRGNVQGRTVQLSLNGDRLGISAEGAGLVMLELRLWLELGRAFVETVAK